MLRQRTASRLQPAGGFWRIGGFARCGKLGRRLILSGALLQFRKLQLQLIDELAAAFGGSAMPGMLQLGDGELQRLDDLIASRHHRFESGDIVRKRR
jgi:hypothetical protein